MYNSEQNIENSNSVSMPYVTESLLSASEGTPNTKFNRVYGRRHMSRNLSKGFTKETSSEILRSPNGAYRLDNINESNWDDASTAVTSEAGFSTFKDDAQLQKKIENSVGCLWCSNILKLLSTLILIIALASPLVMVILPKILDGWETNSCLPTCEADIISLSLRLLVLCVGIWMLVNRRSRVVKPKIEVFYLVTTLFTLFIVTAFWLFYSVRIIIPKYPDYQGIVAFTISFIDSLIFLYYFVVIFIFVRQMRVQYAVKMVRSPDGKACNYLVEEMSIQMLTAWCLDKYQIDFEAYNPYVERINKQRMMQLTSKGTRFKLYDLDGVNERERGINRSKSFINDAKQIVNRGLGHNERFYREEMHERRLKKRRMRLIVAAEESFNNIKKLQEDRTVTTIELTPHDTAQAIFAGLAGPLQKYLRITKQQQRYSIDDIVCHLTNCVIFNMSPRCFVERYLHQGAVIWNDMELSKKCQEWSILTKNNPALSISDGTHIKLERGEVILLINVRTLPSFKLLLETTKPFFRGYNSANKNTETSV